MTGNFFIHSGLLCIFSALIITCSNIISSENADKYSAETVEKFADYIKETESKDEIFIEQDSTEEYFESDGVRYISLIAIPSIGIELPVCSDFSMDNLKKYPCRYYGSAEENNLVIAAHNYESHFGKIPDLQNEDEVILTDSSGRKITYHVTETEVIGGDNVDDMLSGEWDLTLFTCNFSGKSRITVRCVLNN